MKNEAATAANPDIQKIGEMIQDIKVAMLVTHEPDGTLRGRPMMSEEVDFDGTLWFFTGDSSPKSQEIRQDQSVQLTYMDAGKNRYVSLSGTADIVHDQTKAAELWKPAYKAWFPQGLEDPNLALLRVTVTQAEYWNGPAKSVVMLKALASALRGKPLKTDGDHKKVTIPK